MPFIIVIEQEESRVITESTKQDINKSINQEEQDTVKNTINQSNETKEETQVPVNEQATNINNYSIGILAVSSVFLILTIIFLINFIKYQLKRKVKASK